MREIFVKIHDDFQMILDVNDLSLSGIEVLIKARYKNLEASECAALIIVTMTAEVECLVFAGYPLLESWIHQLNKMTNLVTKLFCPEDAAKVTILVQQYLTDKKLLYFAVSSLSNKVTFTDYLSLLNRHGFHKSGVEYIS